MAHFKRSNSHLPLSSILLPCIFEKWQRWAGRDLKGALVGNLASLLSKDWLPVSWITLFGTSKLTWHSSKNLGFTWMILIHPPFHPPFQSLHILLKQKVTDKFKTTSNINNYRSKVIFIGLWDDQLQSTGIKSRTGAFSTGQNAKLIFSILRVWFAAFAGHLKL